MHAHTQRHQSFTAHMQLKPTRTNDNENPNPNPISQNYTVHVSETFGHRQIQLMGGELFLAAVTRSFCGEFKRRVVAVGFSALRWRGDAAVVDRKSAHIRSSGGVVHTWNVIAGGDSGLPAWPGGRSEVATEASGARRRPGRFEGAIEPTTLISQMRDVNVRWRVYR